MWSSWLAVASPPPNSSQEEGGEGFFQGILRESNPSPREYKANAQPLCYPNTQRDTFFKYGFLKY